MANSGFQAAGWNSGTCGFTSPHNVFTDAARRVRLDGKPIDVYAVLQVQQVRAPCEICGQWAICADWPTAPWRHMTAEEVARYVPQEGT